MTAGKILHSYSDHTAPITALAFNPSEFLMVTAGADNVLRFYDLQSFECISVTPPAPGRPQVLRFDPEGSEVYVAYTDSLQVKWFETKWNLIACSHTYCLQGLDMGTGRLP